MAEPWEPDSMCVCGHVLEEHDEVTLYCMIDGRACCGHEPVDDEED